MAHCKPAQQVLQGAVGVVQGAVGVGVGGWGVIGQLRRRSERRGS
jgi:hypothetical protein